MEAGKRKYEGGNEEEDSKLPPHPVKKKAKKPEASPSSRRSGGKKKRVLDDCTSSVALPLDALALVMEFLSPRQLFNVAFTCKTLMARITTKLVIRSGLIHGGHAKQTIQELYKLMSDKSIFIPSSLRLLRLVNGRRCEFCCRCAVNHVRPGLGVFACWNCVTERGLTTPWKFSWARYRHNTEAYDTIFLHPRIATNIYGSKAYMWSCPRNIPLSGEQIGPLVTFDDVDKMFHYTQQPRNKGKTVDTYLSERILAPTEDSYQEFNDTHAETIEQSEKVEKERYEKKAAAKEKAKDNKRAKVDKMVSDLSKLLEEPYRGIASIILKKKDLNYASRTGISKLPTVEFILPFVNVLLKPYVITPSKVRKKILVEIATTINTKLSLITNTKFLTLDFLSDNDPLEAALKGHFSPILTSMDSLLELKVTTGDWRYSYTKYLITDKFITLLEKNQPISALAHLKQRDLSCFLLLEDPSTTQTADEKEKVLVRTVWFERLKEEKAKLAPNNLNNNHSNIYNRTNVEDCDQVFRDAFAASQATFPKALLGWKGYIAWLDKKYPEDAERRDYASDSASNTASYLPLLLEGKYEDIDKQQESSFNAFVWHKYR